MHVACVSVLSLLPLSVCTQTFGWIHGVPDLFNDDSDDGCLSDFGEEVSLDMTPGSTTEITGPFIADCDSEELTVVPVHTTHQPSSRHRRAPVTAIAPREANSGPRRRTRVEKRCREKGESSYGVDDAKKRSTGPRGLSVRVKGQGFALLAANPDISKNDFVASITHIDRGLGEKQVENFFYNCQKRTRFPAFIRDYFDTHPYHLQGITYEPLTTALKPLFLKAGFRRGDWASAHHIRMWGQLLWRGGPERYTSETWNGVEYLRLTREARIELFTQLWDEYGSPPMPALVPAPPARPAHTRTRLTRADRIAGLELLTAGPERGIPDLVASFLASYPDRSEKTVTNMFRRYRGWTRVPEWMHETISANAHLARRKEKMEELRGLIRSKAEEMKREGPYATAEFITLWIEFCVPSVPGGPEPCDHYTIRGDSFVRMPVDVQRAFFSARRDSRRTSRRRRRE